MRYRFEYQRPNKHNQSEWKINVVKAHELYILLNGFSFYKNVQTSKLISNKKVTKIVYLLFKLYTPTFNISHFIEAGIFNERFRKRKEKTAHTILFRMYMPLCIPLFRLCELFKSRKGITKNIRCWINVFDRPS